MASDSDSDVRARSVPLCVAVSCLYRDPAHLIAPYISCAKIDLDTI